MRNGFNMGEARLVTKVEGEKLIIPMVITKNGACCMKREKSAIPYAGYFIKCKTEQRIKIG